MQSLTGLTAASAERRRSLLARTALCGVLSTASAFTATAALALPVGGIAEVSSGGANPVITQGVDRTDVNLNAPRTVLSWSGYDVKPGETVSYNFGARDWIVLNKIIGLQESKIEGVIEGKVGGAFGGNIWFVSQNSIIIGNGARIDAGGLMFGIGGANTATFLDPSNNLFSFSGSDALPNSRLWVLSNASVNGHGGMVAFAGPTVVTRANATVTATDNSVLYGSAKSFSIRLAPGAGGDFDLVDFIVPDITGGSERKLALDLAGETRANSVFVAAVSKSAIGSAVINLEGMITAQAAKADGGDIILSGGGGISGRAAGPTVQGAAPTDIYLNQAVASRDLEVMNVGQIFARPWLRPPEEAKNPTSLAEDAANQDAGGGGGNGNGNGTGNGNGNGAGPFIVDQAEAISTLFNPTAISSITIGRDARIQATASIELGRIVASRDIAVEGLDVTANGLISTNDLTVTSTRGIVELASVGIGRNGIVTGKSDVAIDTISAPKQLNVTSEGGIVLGDGTSSVAGVINLTAAQGVVLNLASAKIDTITAGAFADLRGGALDIGAVTAPRLIAQAASLKIGTATSTGDIYAIASSGDAIVGTANAGDDVYVIATHGTASLENANLSGAGPDVVSTSFPGNPDAAGNGRVVVVQSTDLDAKLGLGTGGVTGATAVSVLAGQDAIVDVIKETPGLFTVSAVRDSTLKAPSVTLDSVASGRDLTVGSTTGDFTLLTSLTATRNISVSAAGALQVGDVTANAGSVSLVGASVKAGNVLASEDVILRALSGGVTTTSYKTGRDLIVQGASLSLGSAIAPVTRDLSITSLGDFTATPALSAGRDLTLDVIGKAVVGSTSAGGNLRIVAGDLDLSGTLVASTAQIEARNGALRVGGSAGDAAGTLSISDNEFSQLRVSGSLRVFAGSTTGSARGDLTLQDLSINPASTPNVAFLVGSSNAARLSGAVTPSVSGGILRIGDATNLNWRPASILVTGSLGAASFSGSAYTNIRAFDEIRLAARQDILMGSQRFITLIQGTAVSDINLAAGKPAGSAPVGDEQFKLFAAAGKLEVSADSKVVQQNTAPTGSLQPTGIFLTGAFDPALIIDPPQIVELNGVVGGQNGNVIGGAAAGGALTFTVVDANGAPTSKPDGANYRFNSCDVGTSNCTLSNTSTGSTTGQMNAGLLIARDQLSSGTPSSDSETSEEAGVAAVSSEALTNPPVLLSLAPVDPDEIVIDPVVTGTGSEEIWRQRRQKK